MPVHVRGVTSRAERLAEPLGFVPDAALAGILHDLGKYSPRFLKRLEGKTPGLDHASAGARAAIAHSQEAALPIALAIEGHHLGIPHGCNPLTDYRDRLDTQLKGERSTGADWQSMLRLAIDEGLSPPPRQTCVPTIPWHPGEPQDVAAEMLDVRMLFSTLVDADYIETEAHFAGDAVEPRRYRAEGVSIDVTEALNRVLHAVAQRQRDARATPNILSLRRQLFERCHKQARDSGTGLFTLTAPTGAGKTLAMLAFALAHMQTHSHLRRLVMVIPYLSIIDQTAKLCRELFGDLGPLVVLEDHSAERSRLYRDEKEKRKISDNEDRAVRERALLAENWDAPIVLTTSLNALESLHDHAPRRCRKLHHLANSVLLFDEVQTIPPDLAQLTLATLSRLAHRFKSTVVFSTATQPTFDSLDAKGDVSRLCGTGWKPREIVGDANDVQQLFDLAKDRYQVDWRLDRPIGWSDLAAELIDKSKDGPVIAIVNLKRHALALLREIQKDKSYQGPLLHLSTNLCPQHRERMLEQAQARLTAQQPMILVATQCIEAGVDISARFVYRALAPLESIAQAAGRCNRHGTDPEPGQVVVFVPEDEAYPPGAYEFAARQTRPFINRLQQVDGINLNAHNILADPDLLNQYYRLLYENQIHASSRYRELIRAVNERDFPVVAEKYRLIDGDMINVLTTYDATRYKRLVFVVERRKKLSRKWVARARPLTVSIRRPRPGDEATAALRPLPPGRDDFETDWFALQELEVGQLYDPLLLGLKELKGTWVF